MLRSAFAIAFVALLVLVPAAPAHGPKSHHGHKSHHHWHHGSKGQDSIPLPPEFRPEGIASGRGDSFYVGSIPQGSVFRGSFRTGEGSVLVPPHPGRAHTGLKVDQRTDRLFVSGGASKGIYVYDAETGADVASFSIPDAGFINDVVLTKRAAFFTDSNVQRIYRVDLGRDGSIGEPVPVPITGDLVYQAGFNANGIEALPDGKTLIVVQSNTGKLFAVDALTGLSREIPLDQPVTNGDGILLHGHTLYVVQNRDNKVAVVRLKHHLREGRIKGYLTDPRFDVPTTIAPFKRSIYAVNARFDRPDVSDDDVVQLRPWH